MAVRILGLVRESFIYVSQSEAEVCGLLVVYSVYAHAGGVCSGSEDKAHTAVTTCLLRIRKAGKKRCDGIVHYNNPLSVHVYSP